MHFDPVPQRGRQRPHAFRDQDEGDGIGWRGQRTNDIGNSDEGEIAHGNGEERVPQIAIIAYVTAHGGDARRVPFGAHQKRRSGRVIARRGKRPPLRHVIAPRPLRLRRQRGPDLRRDGGKEGAGGRIHDPRRMSAHTASERNGGAFVVLLSGGQDGFLHVRTQGVPRRRCDNPVGGVRRLAQETNNVVPDRVHAGGNRQARQCGESISFSASDERGQDISVASTGDRRCGGIWCMHCTATTRPPR
jgi:hypothetical protein